MAAVVLVLLAPLVVTVAVSFSASPVFNLPPPEWSLRWYQRTARLRELWPSVRLSMEIALLSTGISLVLGTLCAIAVARGDFTGKTAVVTFMVSPLMMPGLVVGVAILQTLREAGLRDAWLGLLIGHVVITLPYVTRTVLASLSLFDFTLIEAARTLGYSYPRALLTVMVPVLAPAFLTSGLFAFLASMDRPSGSPGCPLVSRMESSTIAPTFFGATAWPKVAVVTEGRGRSSRPRGRGPDPPPAGSAT